MVSRTDSGISITHRQRGTASDRERKGGMEEGRGRANYARTHTHTHKERERERERQRDIPAQTSPNCPAPSLLTSWRLLRGTSKFLNGTSSASLGHGVIRRQHRPSLFSANTQNYKILFDYTNMDKSDFWFTAK